MNLVFLLAAVVLFLAGAGLMIAAVAGAQVDHRAVTRRVDMVAPTHEQEVPSRPALERWLTQAERILEAVFSFRSARQWGTHSRGRVLLVLGLVAGTCVWLVLHVVLKLPTWLAGPLAIAAFLGAPHFMLSIEQGGAEARFTDRFPDAIDSIIRMLRAGLPISAAIRAVAAEPSPPVDAVFAGLADEMDIGVPLEEALAAAGRRIHLADFRFFTVAVALQHSTGGNLTTTLDILSEIIRKRRAMRMKAKAVTAEVRMTAYVLAAIPLVVVGGLLVINPGYLSPMIHDPRGNMIVAAAVGCLAAGFLTMQQMMHHATRL
jgi:tight adherence protein B